MDGKRVTNQNLFSSLRNFLYTYAEVVKITWRIKKDLFLASTISNAIQGLFVLPSLLITKYFVDNVIRGITTHSLQPSLNNIIALLAIELGIDVIRRAIDRFDWVFTQILSRYLSVELELQAIGKINRLPIASAENPKVRDLFRKIQDRVGQSAWGLIMPISSLPYLLFSIASAVAALVAFNPIMILPAIILSIPEVLVGAANTKESYRLETKISALWRKGNSYEDFLSRGKYLYENKILGHVEKLIAEVWQIAHDTFGERYNVWFKQGKRRFISSIPLGITQTIIKGYLYVQAIVGRITLGTAQMQIQAITSLVSNLSNFGRQINEIQENYLYVSDYKQLLGLPEEELKGSQSIQRPFTTGIEFKDVWFKYPQNNGWTLKGVSFKVDPTDNIAIVGKNGAGKTTIIKLLCKYYVPQKGEILVNGKNIEDYSSIEYRMVISALFQDFAQYPFSAKENIGYGDIKLLNDAEGIKQAAQRVGIDKFIEGLPKQYENPLDNEFEGGIEPSKGQWQRLALARALFRKAEIFILDEPTSNVDPQAEEEIFDQIITLAKEKIVFLVSHRFSTVRKADKILLLDKGKVAEYGSHEELISKKGEYAKLFDLQAKAYQG